MFYLTPSIGKKLQLFKLIPVIFLYWKHYFPSIELYFHCRQSLSHALYGLPSFFTRYSWRAKCSAFESRSRCVVNIDATQLTFSEEEVRRRQNSSI